MSSTGDERWRTTRGQQHPPPAQNQNRQRQNSSRTNNAPSQSKQNAGDQGFVTVNEKTRVNNDRESRESTMYGPVQEQHVPVGGFNASEVQDVLRKAYESAISENGKSIKYRPNGGQINNTKSDGPWASKPNTMRNGKDFFLELRKQVSGLQQAGERAGG